MRRSLFAELRRRNVFRAAVLYVGAAWALAQGISQLGPSVGAPEWTTRWFLGAAVIGFPFWIAFAWFYEFTPEGLKRESEVEPRESITHHTGRKLDFAIIGVLAIAVVLLLTNTFVWHKGAGLNADANNEPIAEHSIAVLPFVNMSDDKSNEYFSDGISEELLNLLAKIPQLQVTARTSSFAFKGKETGIPEIARTLHVAHVLEGSVRKSGNAVRITAQLIRAGTDTHLWSQTYDRKLDDIFAIQDEIAADVVKQLKVTLLGAAPKARTTDPEAYALFLQATQLGRQYTAEAFKQSDALFRKVLAIDPRYAPAWDGLAANMVNRTNRGIVPQKEGFTQAREAAMQAIALEPDYAPAVARLGSIALLENDNVEAARLFERGLALDPANLSVLSNAANMVAFLGRQDEALALREAIVRRDPVNLAAVSNLAVSQFLTGHLDEAITTFRTVLALSPGRLNVHSNLAFVLLVKGDAKAALAEAEQEKSELARLAVTAAANHALGRRAESEAALATLIDKFGNSSASSVADVYALRNERDQAFEWLDKAVVSDEPGIAQILADNLLDNLHADARWAPFLRRIGKAPEQLAKIEFKVTLPKEWQAERAASRGTQQ